MIWNQSNDVIHPDMTHVGIHHLVGKDKNDLHAGELTINTGLFCYNGISYIYYSKMHSISFPNKKSC